MAELEADEKIGVGTEYTNKQGQTLFTDLKTEEEGIEFYASAQHPKLNLSMRNLGDAVTLKLTDAFTEVRSPDRNGQNMTWFCHE